MIKLVTIIEEQEDGSVSIQTSNPEQGVATYKEVVATEDFMKRISNVNAPNQSGQLTNNKTLMIVEQVKDDDDSGVSSN